ncbi:MAG: Rieske 2Fe-2S domain-containing protein [Anaerolineales bacterium]|nr:Rieske 2Fe-2S domain-containing protein [Chloroflexota bacterium]MBL6982643.1 Rieske 2Fe-2S domain-containing protein [Anaerolineales bacterium]
MTEKKSKITRSQFLGIAWGGSLALIFAQVAVALLRFIQPISTGGFGGLVYAGKIDEFAIDSVNRILAGRFFISRTPDGIMALWQKCTHLGCAVPWDEKEGKFHCPCHGSVFDVYGEVLSGPAPRALDYFPVEIKSGEVWVDTGTPTQRSKHDPSHITGA